MGLLDALGLPAPATAALRPEAVQPRSALPGQAAGARPAPGGFVAGGADVEVITRQLGPYKVGVGDLKLGLTVKATATGTGGDADGDAGFTATGTMKDKGDGKRPVASKKTFTFQDIADRELFAGITFEHPSVNAEFEVGDEVTVAGTAKFKLVSPLFSTDAQVKLTLLKIKGMNSVAGPSVEIKFKPVRFTYQRDGVSAEVAVETKAGYEIDPVRAAKKYGKEAIERLARRALESAARRQGVKFLGRKAAEQLLTKFGPLAAALGVGLDIGALLNAYTIAPEVSQTVIEEVLGDLNDRYHSADTLGKMWLVSKNSPRIVGALLAAGVTGAFAGMTDLVLFKLLGLDRLRDFAVALAAFEKGLTELAKVAAIPADAIAGSILYGAYAMGIKTHPRHAVCAHAALEPVVDAVHRRLRPHYRERGGLNKVIGLTLANADPPHDRLLAFAGFAVRSGFDGGGRVDLGSPERAAAAMRALPLPDFIRYLEGCKMLRCNVKIGDGLDADSIDDALLDELTN
jgi:hypothetical protein